MTNGYGIKTETSTNNFICTPINGKTSVSSYVVINYNNNNYAFNGDNENYGISANETKIVTVVYSIEELFQALSSSSNEATTYSRASGNGFKTLDLKPIKVIYGN